MFPEHPRRRGWGASLCLLALLHLVVGFLGTPGCAGGDQPRTPEGAVRALVTAARTADRANIYRRLGPTTRARIDGLLAASRKMSGRVVMKPEDFLSVAWAPPAWEVAGTRLLHAEEATAEVEVYSAAGDRASVELVREGEEWKIELPGR